MEKLRRERGCLRSQATKLIKQIEELDKNDENPDRNIKLKALKTHLEDKKQELKDLDKKILAISDESELDQEVELTDSYQLNLIESLQKIDLILREKKEDAEKTDCNIGIVTKEPALTVRLPKIELKKFDGKITEWLTFWQTYKSTIHKRKDLTGIEKLNYLHSLLEGEAAATIRGFAIIEENYEDIIKVLKDRFGNTEAIIELHINKILKLKPIKEVFKVKELRELLIEVENHLRTLKNLKVDPSRCSEIFKIKMKELFPVEMLIEYERQRNGKEEDINSLVGFLKKEIQIREAVTPATVWNTAAPVFKPRSSSSLPYARNIHQQWSPRYTPKFVQRGPTHQSVRPGQFIRASTPRKQNIICFRCDQPGHYQRDCKTS